MIQLFQVQQFSKRSIQRTFYFMSYSESQLKYQRPQHNNKKLIK